MDRQNLSFLQTILLKRNDREALRLAEALKIGNEIQNRFPECRELAEQMNDIQDHLKDTRQRCHDILERVEQNLCKSRSEEIKEQTKKKWDEFLKEKDKEEEKIEKDFMTKSLKLERKVWHG